MTMAITRRTTRRSEPCLNDMEGPSLTEPTVSVRRYTSSSNMPDVVTALPSTSSLGLSRRQRQRLQLVIPCDIRIKRMKAYIRSKSPRYLACIALILMLTLWCLISMLIVHLFGPNGSVKGGKIGYLLDQFAKDYVRYHVMSNWREEIRNNLQIPMAHSEQDGKLFEPRFWPFDGIIKTRPNAALVEMLMREKSRVEKLHDVVQSSSLAIDRCRIDSLAHIEIPATVLQLERNSGHMNQLLPYWVLRSQFLRIDSVAIYKKDLSMLPRMDLTSCQNIISGINNYAISVDVGLHCLAFNLGSMQLSSTVSKKHRSLVETVMKTVKSTSNQTKEVTKNNTQSSEGLCSTKVGYAILSSIPAPELELRKTSSVMSYVSTIYSALPPQHFASLCLPPIHGNIGISPYTEANIELSFQSIFVNKLTTTISHSRSNPSLNNTDVIWGVARFHCDFESYNMKCCNDANVSILNSFDDKPQYLENYLQENKEESKFSQYLIFTVTDDIDDTITTIHHASPTVVIKEARSNTPNTANHIKQSIQDSFKSCQPGWWCNRCLQTSLYGSFSTCKPVCKSCVADIICGNDHQKTQNVTINVHTKESSYPSPMTMHQGMKLSQQRIPRIIHQTWFEDITLESYPQLYRLQNTWKASGWDYRFYTDDTARKYIQDNYPPRFVAVFDSLIPGAYKADFFRYLVLYKDGGVYVDVDVMLNANLDSFISPDLAFFAPIDAVGSYADEQFCVWNGLIGSAPAHPILTNVIEWMVNLVSIRGDMYDMERAVCRFSNGKRNIENWKLRAEPSLMLSGPCSLGLSVNMALENEPLTKFDTGLQYSKTNNTASGDMIGDVMILVADKQDLGAFRFSDPERNIVVATTDMLSLSKSPMTYEMKASGVRGNAGGDKKVKPHYSISTKGELLWGTHDVYSDELVAPEHIHISVVRNHEE